MSERNTDVRSAPNGVLLSHKSENKLDDIHYIDFPGNVKVSADRTREQTVAQSFFFGKKGLALLKSMGATKPS
jgi:hypothetical protein